MAAIVAMVQYIQHQLVWDRGEKVYALKPLETPVKAHDKWVGH